MRVRPVIAWAIGSLLIGGAVSAVADGAKTASSELDAALISPTDPARGQVAYQTCSVCHGAEGAGRSDGTFPQLAGQHATVIMKQLVDIRAGRRQNPVMLEYATRLMDAQEIADVAVWLSAMQPTADNGTGPGTDLENAAQVYERDCAQCHGAGGEGNAELFMPAIAGQHYQYLLRQIRDIGSGRRGNAHPEMAALTERFTDADLRALADYASRLEMP